MKRTPPLFIELESGPSKNASLEYPPLNVDLSTSLYSEIGIDEFVLLSAGKIGDRWVATPQLVERECK
jgi:hypothetical protein